MSNGPSSKDDLMLFVLAVRTVECDLSLKSLGVLICKSIWEIQLSICKDDGKDDGRTMGRTVYDKLS